MGPILVAFILAIEQYLSGVFILLPENGKPANTFILKTNI
jgi:hypothetical protein